MNDPAPELVAFVHGELDADAARAVRERLHAEPALRAELAALRAADAALLDALEAPVRRRERRAWWRPVLAAAALAVVAVLSTLPRDEVPAAQNDVVGLRVQPYGGARQPVFTDVALEFDWQNRLPGDDGRSLTVVPFRLGDTVESIGRSAVGAAAREVPLVVSAMLLAPDGQRLAARLAAPKATVTRAPHLQIEPLRAFEVDTDAPPPYLGGRPGQRAWLEDFAWAAEQMPTDGPRRLLLDQVGEWTIELRVESVPPPEAGLWPVFREPLVVATKVFATGIVSDWGEPFDGMQARLVLATGCDEPDHAPLALQLRNVSDRMRRYNVVGRTAAEIPQPFHFGLSIGAASDAAAPSLRDDLAVRIDESVLMVAHPPGTIRSLVVKTDYWRGFGLPLAAQSGSTTLSATFHFRPTAWSDLELWQGEIATGALHVPPRDRR